MLFGKKPHHPNLNYDAYKKSWYFDFTSRWNEVLSFEKSSDELQNEYLDELALRLKANANNKNLKLLNEYEVKEFWEGVRRNLQYIDDVIIINKRGFYNAPLRHFLLKLKGDRVKTVYSLEGDDIEIRTKSGTTVTRASDKHVFIEMMSYDKAKNCLTIMGSLTFPFGKESTRLVASINGKEKVLKDSGVYNDYKFFGDVAYHKFAFRVDIQLDDTFPVKLNFHLMNRAHSTKVPLKLNFNTYMSKLAGRITYWRFGKYIAVHNKKSLYVKKANSIITLLRELVFLFTIGIVWRRPRTAVLRTLYWLTKPILGQKNIWLYSDKIYKAGDNAEWLYRYAIDQQDNISHYYALRGDSPDAKRFKKDGIKYLKYKTVWMRLLFLHANILVFTHNNAPGYYRVGGVNNPYFRGLYNYDIMYIQHGLAVQDTSWLFKKPVDDFRLFFVASKFETNNLLRPAYGYKKSEIVQAGQTRYDGLVNNDKKNIIITPTWRTYLAPPGKGFGESRDPHELFKESDFYKIYNSLITNKKLIDTARRKGYSITYLLHPVMSSNINDFESSSFVKVISANDDFNYQKAMTEASLMVTDYSGVQFDFAYMYKPVVYFHPPELPASYDEAIYKYNEHALGDITISIDELVSTVCEYIENGCRIKPRFKKRIDSFFYHHDHKNSERTYKRIRQWQSSINAEE